MSKHLINPMAQVFGNLIKTYIQSTIINILFGRVFRNMVFQPDYVTQTELDNFAILSQAVQNDNYLSPCDN